MDGLQQTLALTPQKNTGLFSEYYLDGILAEQLADYQAKDTYLDEKYLQKNWDLLTEKLAKIEMYINLRNEAQTKRDVIEPILTEVLGHFFDVEFRDGNDNPDYTLFASEEDLEAAKEHTRESQRYREFTIGLADAKSWRKTGYSNLESSAPIAQIHRYLTNHRRRWGFITNGNQWRLFAHKEGIRQDQYIEFTLKDILAGNRHSNEFRLFLALFRREAFVRDAEGKSFLDKVLEQSIQQAEGLQRDLKEKVYLAFGIVAEEFRRMNKLPLDTDEAKQELRSNSLVFLYRILFLLYGEDRLILPIADEKTQGRYYQYSLRRIRNVVEKVSDPLVSRTRFWEELVYLFKVIHGLDAKGNILAENMEIPMPSYNGGLFDPKHWPNLEQWRLGDSALRKVLLLLTKTKRDKSDKSDPRATDANVSYRELGVQHLGNIYEGILENILVLEDGKVVVQTDNGERKATGSYYTPDYIVDYIVKETIGPLVVSAKTRDDILKMKVLDPAMGSGHFLIGAIDFLAEQLANTKESYSEEELKDARREVAERCIYGVDINPMAVELAKLSIWLHTISKEKPLAFLDNHIKCGNSLIGARIADLHTLPQKKKGVAGQALTPDTDGETINLFPEDKLVQEMKLWLGDGKVFTNPSDTIEDVKLKEIAEKVLDDRRMKYRHLADLWTSFYFQDVPKSEMSILYRKLAEAISVNAEESPLPKTLIMDEALRIAKEKRFFHWEFEFPEIFFDNFGRHKGEDAGFYAVIGNPPYDVISEKEQAKEVSGDKLFFLNRPEYQAAVGSKLNLYRLFALRSMDMVREHGYGGYIVPMALLADGQSKSLRSNILLKSWLRKVEAFPQKDKVWDRVFEEAKLSTCIYIIKKDPSKQCFLRVHPGRDILDLTPKVRINLSLLRSYDPEGLCFPCYPNSMDGDLRLAAKIHKCADGGSAKNYFISQQGEVNLTTNNRLISKSSSNRSLILRGAHIDRYRFNSSPKQGETLYLDVASFLESRKPGSKAFDNSKLRIGYQRGSAIDNWKRIIATIIEPPSFCSDTINYIVDPSINLYTVLGLLNSRLWNWRFRLTSSNNHVNSYEIDGLPLHSFSFTTPNKTREKLARQLISLSGKAIGSVSQNEGDDEIRKQPHPVIELAKKYALEKNDVLHDFLAHLAEQMISMNKKKQSASAKFFDWMTNHDIKPRAEMKPKTYLDEFWKLEMNDFNRYLSKNNVVLPKITRDYLEEEFSSSKNELQILSAKIELTDLLIDQVVYALYGLTDEEIAIVERS